MWWALGAALLLLLLAGLRKPQPARSYSLLFNGKVYLMNSYSGSYNVPVRITLTPTPEANGNPTVAPPGVPVWAPIDPSAGTLVPSADGMSALLTPSKPESLTIQAANGPCTGNGTANFTGASATSFDMTFTPAV